MFFLIQPQRDFRIDPEIFHLFETFFETFFTCHTSSYLLF